MEGQVSNNRPSKLELLTSLGVRWEQIPAMAVSKYISKDRDNRAHKREELISVANLLLMEALPSLRLSHRPEALAKWLLQRLQWGLSNWEVGERRGKRGGLDLLLGEDPRLLIEECYAATDTE